MFNEIGKKIKKLISIVAILEVIFLITFCIFGVVVLGGWFILLWFIIIPVGIFIIWVLSCRFYAYGELVDNSTEIKKELAGLKSAIQSVKSSAKQGIGAREFIEYDKEILYEFAMDMIQKKNYKFAYNALRKIRDYKDADKWLDSIAKELLETMEKAE